MAQAIDRAIALWLSGILGFRGCSMRFMQLAAGAVAALLLSSSMAAASAYDAFKSYCIDTKADEAAALAHADADGWLTINREQVPIPPQAGFSLTEYNLRLSAKSGDQVILLAGRGRVGPAKEDAPAHICMVMAKSGDGTELAAVEGWVGVPPMMSQASSNMKIYVFEDTPAGRSALKYNDDAKTLLPSGRVTMVITASPPNGAMIILGYVRLAP